MFSGEFNHTIDEKGRIIIPNKFRTLLGDSFTVSKSLDGCLSIYDKEEWDSLSKKLNTLPMTDERARFLKRFLLGGSIEVSPDKTGRILLNKNLIDSAKLNKEIIFVGVGSYIEVWDIDEYRKKNNFEDFEKISASMEGLGI